MGLRTKLLVMLLGLLLFPLAVLSGGAYWYFENKLQKEALSYLNNIVGQLILNARTELERPRLAAEQLAVDPRMTGHLGDIRVSRAAVTDRLRAFQMLNPSIQHISLHDHRGRLRAQQALPGGGLSGSALEDMRMFGGLYPDQLEQQLLNEGHLGELVSLDDGSSALRIAVAVTNRAGNQLLGYLLLTTSMGGLEKMIFENDTRTTRFFFIDAQGALLAKSEGITFTVLPKSALAGTNEETSEGQRYSEVELAGVSYLLNLRRVNDGIWLGSMIDLDAITISSLDFLYVLIPATAVLFSVIGFVLYLRVARDIIKPIDRLIDATRDISKGQFQPRIDIDSNDELGELAQAFRVMGVQLNDTNEKVMQLAFYDPLTRLPNRNTLKLTLKSMIEQAERNKMLLAVLFIDLDDFKKVNDRLGHEAGDELLVQIGQRLQKRLRGGDMIAGTSRDELPEQVISRRGGDEFNALINQVRHPREAALVAERLITDINEPVMLGGSPVSVGASVGVALYPQDGKDPDTLLRHADMAMYEAKNLGKNKYYLFTEAINTQVHQRLELEQNIAKGLVNNEFQLYYQPKVDLKTMRVAGFEALIRWIDPEKGMISPAEFIPVAEESNLIHDLGRWVMAEALHQLQLWESELPMGLRIAINVSARQMAQENFAEQIISLAQQFGVPLTRLEIELTETSILTDEILVKQHLYALRTAGVKVSLDDFGTGYSSLTFLRNLPIDSVKIDRSFVMRLAQDSESQAIVLSVLELCDKLSLETVAEGVETPDQLTFLAANDCTEGQGYLFARPLPADDVLKFLQAPEYLAL
ncbi:EAL domain-containing protein [Pseudomaricurvus alkylphenolicus]|jgi:diguanylate cyclase (GGDEF)-like protein|uniref:putative bifunctional diguanylate cyclase/phosphodiesterase n=1 Tax=Pseudomaricurvus alkylphenolicus TaxID=1306991 RepID=UPI00141D8D7C|nr:EAL domain-containing protein [Pseudomaricurvus alkylphenolicus]NIB42725.1 EAL domain-containing protein [Pseudomaricurvus alkylphenolicus]